MGKGRVRLFNRDGGDTGEFNRNGERANRRYGEKHGCHSEESRDQRDDVGHANGVIKRTVLLNASR
jgi:hypothetical protein